MYAVVGCSSCESLWVIDTDVESTTCPRCGRRHQVERLKAFVRTDSVEQARAVRARLLANRQDQEIDIEDVSGDVSAAGIDDEEYLAASGIDTDAVAKAGDRVTDSNSSLSQRAVVTQAVQTLSTPTEAAVLSYAEEHGVDADTAEQVLHQLVETGALTEQDGRYRVL